MTERILSPQLLKLVQAAGPGYSQANPEWVKKFAELIVRECADYALEKGRASPDTDFRTGSLIISEFLLAHFGVEEGVAEWRAK
jgi:hypothetical protein